MYDRFLQDLSDPDPTKRRDAIFALARAGDPRAIDPLNRMQSIESDLSLRQLAQKAVNHLQKQQWDQAMAQAIAEGTIAAPPVPAPEAPKGAVDLQKKLGRTHLDQAAGFRILGQNDKAIHSLAQAIATDPDLKNDRPVRDLVSALFDKPPAEAMLLLDQYITDQKVRPDTTSIRIELPWGRLSILVAETIVIFMLIMGIVYYGRGSVFAPFVALTNIVLSNTNLTQAQVQAADTLYQKTRDSYQHTLQPDKNLILKIVALSAFATFSIVGGNAVIYVVAVVFGGSAAPLLFIARLTRVSIVMVTSILVAAVGLADITRRFFAGASYAKLSDADSHQMLIFMVVAAVALLGSGMVQAYLTSRDNHLTGIRSSMVTLTGNLLFLVFSSLVFRFVLG
jgi:hypothetical protein